MFPGRRRSFFCLFVSCFVLSSGVDVVLESGRAQRLICSRWSTSPRSAKWSRRLVWSVRCVVSGYEYIPEGYCGTPVKRRYFIFHFFFHCGEVCFGTRLKELFAIFSSSVPSPFRMVRWSPFSRGSMSLHVQDNSSTVPQAGYSPSSESVLATSIYT